MYPFIPFLPVVHGLVVSPGVFEQSEGPDHTVETASLQHPSHIQKYYAFANTDTLKHTRTIFAAIVPFAVVAALALLVLQCFRALTNGRSTRYHGEAPRGLAEKGGTHCSVSHRVENAASAAALLPLHGSIFVGGTDCLSLRLRLRA